MKKAIVIGATSGIGKGLAKILVDNNYIVGITGRRTNLLEELKSEKPNSYFIKTIDVKHQQDTTEKLDELITEMGGIDLLFLSSGIGDFNPRLDYSIEKETIETNIIGFTSISNWGFKVFEKQKYGHLVAISSVGGLRGSRQAPAYNATKAYQINYLEGLRQKSNNIKAPIFVTDVRAGFVDTFMAKGENLFWVASVEKATQQIFKAIKRRNKIVYVTKRWRLIALILRCIPRLIYDRL